MLRSAVSLFILGFSFGSGPCLTSCGPLLLSYIVGTQKRVAAGLFAYSLFSLVRIVVYLLLAILVFLLGRWAIEGLIGGVSRYLFILGGTFMVLLGTLVILSRRRDTKWCSFLKNRFLEHDKKSIVLLGLLTAIFPCAPLMAMFSYLALISDKWWQSLVGALSFSLGVFISPLILLSALGGLLPQWLKGQGARVLSYLGGIIMVILGLQLARKAF
jgi:hypothetical protein